MNRVLDPALHILGNSAPCIRVLPSMKSLPLVLAWLGVLLGISFAAPPALKTETFDRDPGWEGHNNHIVPKEVLKVTQDFGYSATNHAGKAAGEIGGHIQRSTTPAYYAAEI